MYKTARPIILQAETPVHPGSGTDLGYIDNPIQREVHTGYPKIEGSTLKGALRQAFETKADNDNQKWIQINKVFGYDEDLPENIKTEVENAFKNGDELKTDFAGAITFTDARILLFPVKSLKGTFAWVTCPRVLAKFKKELEEICMIEIKDWDISKIQENFVTSNCSLFIDEKEKSKIQLDEYIYTVTKNEEMDKLAQWLQDNIFSSNVLQIGDITKNLMIVSNDDFADFVKFGTEVATRIKIDNETGTVKDGALFTVEYLPSETLMYSLVMFSSEFRENGMSDREVEKFFKKNKPDHFQLGGDATLGKGVFSLKYINPNGKEENNEHTN